MVHDKIIKFTRFVISCLRNISMELLCMKIMGFNGNFEVLTQNFGFMPGYTFSVNLTNGKLRASRIRVLTAAKVRKFSGKEYLM
jgi:hypothetical protein